MKTQRILALAAVLPLTILLGAAIYLVTASVAVSGTVTDAISSATLAGATVTCRDSDVQSDGEGRYALAQAPRNGMLTISLDGYLPVQAVIRPASWLKRDATLDASLQPVVLDGLVTDAASGQPLAGVTLTAGEQMLATAADGAFRFLRVRRQAAITARADGYVERQLAFGGEPSLAIALEPNTVTVAVTDNGDGSLIGHALVSRSGQTMQPTGDGRLALRGVNVQTEISAQADGYQPAAARYSSGTTLTITLTANSVTGQVRDQRTGQPLRGITITMQDVSATRTALSGDMGQFQLRRVRSGAALTASGPEHATAAITYTGQASLTFSLRPDTLRGVVSDRYSGQPMPGVTITLRQADTTRAVRSNDSGEFQIAHAPLGATILASATDHAADVITYTGQMSVAFSLRPNVLRGVVRDGKNGQPVAGAEASVGAVSAKTAADGTYALSGIPDGLPLIVSATGFDRMPVTIGPFTTLDVRLGPTTVRAIYIPFYLLTSPDRVRALISFASSGNMNAIVVDIKSDDGYLAYKSTLPLAKEIGAEPSSKAMSLAELLKLAKERGLYLIARMVVFKDNLLAQERPDLAVKDKRTSLAWDDCGNGSTLWVDPFRKEVVDYNAGLAEEAGRMGFDEIQFDYIRFPPACISGAPLSEAQYVVTSTMETRLAAIETFLSEARKRLKPLGVAIAVDTFGWTLFRDNDLTLGQRMENMAAYVDYICPMVYPSTWEDGAIGLDYVPAHPYEIVYESVKFGVNRLKAFPGVKIRPWLQDYDDYSYKQLPYGVKELDAQRRGAYDGGAAGWMLWNAWGAYTEETATRP